MRVLTIIVFVMVLSAVCVDVVCPRRALRPFADVLQEEINSAGLRTYTDKDFGYSVRYPDCSRRETDPGNGYVGQARFCYDSWVRISLECYVTRAVDKDNVTVCGIDRMAGIMHARKRPAGSDAWLLSGPLYEEGVRMEGYSHYTKCLRRGKLWFVYALSYPDAYRGIIARLFWLIDNWRGWEDTGTVRIR